MNTRLAIIDLDDTLLGPDKQISPDNKEALERLRASGFDIVIASGRHHKNILRFKDHVGAMSWTISSQGAVVRHAGTNELLQEFTVPEAEALALYELGRRAGLTLLVYHRDGVFMEAESEWTRLYASRTGWSPETADLSGLAASGVQKLILCESAGKIAELFPEMKGAYGGRLYVVVTDPEYLEFASPSANKALAAESLASKLRVERRDIIAFGDGNNDAELLAWAGFSVAMAHGRDTARKAASKISPPGPPETAFARAVDLALAQR
ncbi:Cof-type HAD-IIB family hydrolase [Sorangium sp. So ce375]|uniref:Cof-type HAD-IIB family hydrolase n=1 Tax=Sorangium sp. So ce375 TaxID=3133306 RepID=UPI003F5B1EE3